MTDYSRKMLRLHNSFNGTNENERVYIGFGMHRIIDLINVKILRST